MKIVKSLNIPFNDAIDYNDPDKIEEFVRQYNVTSAVNKLDQPNTYFVIGEKGTGKTAITLYYVTNNNHGRKQKFIPLSETFYQRFIYLKKNGKIGYTDYSTIWRCLVMANHARVIYENANFILRKLMPKYRRIRKAIKYFDLNSTKPEVEIQFEYIEKIIEKGGINYQSVVSGESNYEKSATKKTTDIQRPFEEIETKLRRSLERCRYDSQVNLFFDGIDAKPVDVETKDYHDCLRELAVAARQLNTEIYKKMKKHLSKFRVILLLRPDIFVELGIYNSTSVVIDNSVLLNWDTSIRNYKSSDLFTTIDKYFYSQNQDDKKYGWDAYFARQTGSRRDIVFIELLDRSLQRPRDYFTAIKYLIMKYKNDERPLARFNVNDVIGNTEFLKNFSLYLLGEVQNYANFYMSNEDFEEYRQFFKYLPDPIFFTPLQYQVAYTKFKKDADQSRIVNKDLYRTPKKLLQFFYDVNVIGYRELTRGGYNHHFAYRDRNIYNVYPRVKTEKVEYMVFKGIRRALEL